MSKKSILIVTQYFYPESFRGNDIAFELQKRGYNVTVLTGIPNYPQGIFYKGYGFFRKRKEIINGVQVIRTFLFPRKNGKGFNLFLNYLSWSISSTFFSIYLGFFIKFDKIFVQQLSPVTVGIPAVIIKKIQKIPLFFWVLDLWPESLNFGAEIKNSFVTKFFNKIVTFLYRNSDVILISSKGFINSIIEKGNFSHKIKYFPNWSDNSIMDNNINDSKLPNLPDGFIVMFAGNIGKAQDLFNVIKAAEIVKKINMNIKFILLGTGRVKNDIEDFIEKKNLKDTVFFIGKFPIETMRHFYSKSNCMLVSLEDIPIFNLTLPAKIQSYMQAKKPILGMINGEGFNLINEANCGFSANAGSFNDLAQNVIKMYNLSEDQREELGRNGYEYYMNNFDFKISILKLENLLNSVNYKK